MVNKSAFLRLLRAALFSVSAFCIATTATLLIWFYQYIYSPLPIEDPEKICGAFFMIQLGMLQWLSWASPVVGVSVISMTAFPRKIFLTTILSVLAILIYPFLYYFREIEFFTGLIKLLALPTILYAVFLLILHVGGNFKEIN
jgi:hypothetical protein